ncbi:MAG: helix-turn-helix transcriptional regulator [Clostridia bacterium]|nr:helix-turn-helix transcriptional regulator [Clostridia bacterium]
MTNINIGNKIRELRKKKGITQDVLASVLSVSPQAVSKWESGLTYPDMEMIPVIAGYFEVSLDILFDYDVREMKLKIQKIIDNAMKCLYDNTPKCIEIIKTALCEYPGNEELMTALLDAYEYDLRDKGNTSQLDEMIELSQKIITESTDFIRVCNVKDIQAAAYLKKGEYEKAKSVLETLPREYNLRGSAFAFRLSGKDKQDGAIRSRCHHLQGLYQACMEEGDSWFFMYQHPDVKFRDFTPDEYIPMALKCYKQGLRVLTTFLLTDYYDDPADQYLWDGMQTFHWIFHQRIAACHKKLGNMDECEKSIAEAYRLISVVWKDFEENKEEYMKYFNQYLTEYDLAEYIK